MHLWLVGKRVVGFLLVLIELFTLALTIEEVYELILVEIVLFKRGWVTSSTSFRGRGRPPKILASKN